MEDARTQMIATLGPSSSNGAMLKRLFDAGVDIFRVNLSHGDRDMHREAIRLAAETGAAVMIDLCGPKVRVQDGSIPFPIRIARGEKVSIASSSDCFQDGMTGILLPPGIAYTRATEGSKVLIDDGNIELVVREVHPDFIVAESVSDGEIHPRKGIAFSDDLADFPPLLESDKKALKELAGEPFDIVAASFVRSVDTIVEIEKELDRQDCEAAIVAKIEDPSGVRNAEEIIKAADGIMVARGDLGVCTPIAALPILQKRLIALGNYYRKMVIVATQMLESMTEHTRPTRAEVTDVANAVLDGADALMLSGETAVGKYPVETVETMARIIAHAEAAFLTGLAALL